MQNASHTFSLTTRKLAAVGYVPLLGFIVLFGHHPNRFIFGHAVQGCVLSLYFFAAYFLTNFGAYVALLVAGGMVAGFIHAIAGQQFRLPVLSHLADWLAAEKFDGAAPRS